MSEPDEEAGDGEAAFPRSDPLGRGYTQVGMSLRDYFAGQALVGILACRWPPPAPEAAGLYAFQFADAVLKVREQ